MHYSKKLLDHYKNPKNFGKIKAKSVSSHAENPSCGDSIKMDVIFKGDRIGDIKFSGNGCSIAIAAASLVTEKAKGLKITEIADIDLPDVEKLLGMNIHPSRKSCAMLGLNVLKKIVLKELKKR